MQHPTKKTLCAAMLLLGTTACASAAPGDVDVTWSDDGHLITTSQVFFFPSMSLVDTVSAPDGGFYQVGSQRINGSSSVTVARYLADGQQDLAFGLAGQESMGIPGVEMYPSAAAVQPDGRLLVTGSLVDHNADELDIFACRFNVLGSDYSTFGNPDVDSLLPNCVFAELPGNDLNADGQDLGSSIVVMSDGSIAIAGTSEWVGGRQALVVMKLDKDGTVVQTFGNVADRPGLALYGLLDRDIVGTSVGLQSDGSIIVGGRWTPAATNNTDMAVVKFDASGKIATGFGDRATKGARGIAFDIASNRQDELRTVVVAPDDSVIIGGSVRAVGLTDHVGVARLTKSGNLDTGFGTGGRTVLPLCTNCTQSPLRDMALQADGRVLLVASIWDNVFQDIGVARLTAAGKLDPTFTGNGRVIDFPLMQNDDVVGLSNDRGVSVMVRDDGIYVGGSVQINPGDLTKRGFSLTRLKSN